MDNTNTLQSFSNKRSTLNIYKLFLLIFAFMVSFSAESLSQWCTPYWSYGCMSTTGFIIRNSAGTTILSYSGTACNEFSSSTCTLIPGQTYSFSWTGGLYFGSVYYAQYMAIYLDADNNYSFSVPTERLWYSTSSSTSFTGTFTLPSAGTSGTRRLMVVNNYYAYGSQIGSTPCYNGYGYGSYTNFNISTLYEARCKNAEISLNNNGTASISASDVYDGNPDDPSISSLSLDKSNFNCDDVGDNEVELTVTYTNNTTSSCTAIVTVLETIAPTVITKNITLPLSGGTATLNPEDIDDGSYDNCSIESMSVDLSSFDCDDIGEEFEVTLTVTDVNGNSASGTAIVNIEGEIPDVSISANPEYFVSPGGTILTKYIGYGTESTTLTASGGVSYSWTSSPEGFTSSEANPTVTPLVTTTYTVVVYSESGCSSSSSITIDVQDVRCDIDKVKVCHDGTISLCISSHAVPAHLNEHGDYLGDCNTDGKVVIRDDSDLNNELSSGLNSFELIQNYPNPFSDGTVIEFVLNESMNITLKIFDASGRLVQDAMSGNYNMGTYKYTFKPNEISAGSYECVLTCNGFSKSMTMKVIR